MILFLSGLVTALAFPTSLEGFRLPNLGWVAWVSLVPLYRSLREGNLPEGNLPKATFWQGMKRGLLFAVGFYGLTLHWVYIALHRYGEMSRVAAVAGLLGAVLIVSFFFVLLCGGVAWLTSLGGPCFPQVLRMTVSMLRISTRRSKNLSEEPKENRAKRGLMRFRCPLWLVFPTAWVVHDFALNFFPFGGFPWCRLAYSQGEYLRLVQSADLFGIYGITFLIVLVNGAIASLNRKALLAALLLSLLDVGYGHFRLAHLDRTLASLPTEKVALVQGNIPQDEKWLMELGPEVMARHLYYTHEAEKEKPQLIFWPEAAYPYAIPDNASHVTGLEELKTPLLMGVVTFEGTPPDFWSLFVHEPDFSLFNGAMLVAPGGKNERLYHKHHLVPFGEYVPWEKVFFFLDKIVPAAASFKAGEKYPLLSFGPVALGVTICYEDLFPEIFRTFVRKGATLLVNLTNGAWYDQSSMIYQHLEYSRLRAIENRRSLIRDTNNGITAVIEPTGQIIRSLPPFIEGVLSADVKIGGPPSLYTKWGDWFAWGCVLVVGMLVIIKFLWAKN